MHARTAEVRSETALHEPALSGPERLARPAESLEAAGDVPAGAPTRRKPAGDRGTTPGEDAIGDPVGLPLAARGVGPHHRGAGGR